MLTLNVIFFMPFFHEHTFMFLPDASPLMVFSFFHRHCRAACSLVRVLPNMRALSAQRAAQCKVRKHQVFCTEEIASSRSIALFRRITEYFHHSFTFRTRADARDARVRHDARVSLPSR